jgi:hypothetical protein
MSRCSWEWLSITVDVGAHAAVTRTQAVHVASSRLLALVAEQFRDALLDGPSDWELVSVRKLFKFEGETVQ